MDRVLVWSAAGLAAGIAAAASGRTALALTLLLGCATAMAAGACRWNYRQHLVAALLFCGVGALLWGWRHPESQSDPLRKFAAEHPDALLSLEGTVRQAPLLLPGTDYARFVLDVDQVQRSETPQPIRGRVLVRWTEPGTPVFSGERVRLEGRLSQRLGPVNFGVRGIEGHYRAQGVHTTTSIRGAALQKLGAPRVSVIYWASRLRAAEAGLLQQAVPPHALPFVLTVWLGERGQISQPVYEDFLASGTAHILAVSGVHVGLIFLSAQFLLRGLIASPRRRALVIIVLVFAFAFAAGARVSSLRAATMIALYVAAELLRRDPDAPTALGIAAMLLLFLNPMSLFEPGFILSFASVASLLLFVPAFERWFPEWPAGLRMTLAPPLAVQILSLPMALHYFHVLPLAAALVNIVVIPLLTAVLWLTFAAVLLGAVFLPAAAIFGHAAGVAVWLIAQIASRTASIPGLHLLVTSPTWTAIVLYYAAAALLLLSSWQSPMRRRLVPAAVAAILLAVLVWRPIFPHAGVDFLDVGHGDSTFVRTPGGTTLLVDGGDRNEYTDMGQRVVLPFLLTRGITRVDHVVVSHPDRDHIGGLLWVARKLRVGQVVLGPESGHILEAELLALCAQRGIPVRRVYAGDTLEAAGATVEVLHPPAGWRPELSTNEQSLVLRVRWPGMDLLLSGDVEKQAEARLATVDCAAALLKVPHHGSDTSSTPAFVEAVRPAAAVVSVVPRSTFRTANPAVLQRYTDLGTALWRTDLDGGVQVRAAPGGLHLHSAREAYGWSLR